MIKRRIIFLVLAVIFSQHYYLYGQGRNNIYLFGYTGSLRAMMDLKTGVPVITQDSARKIKLSCTHANISDLNGNLLFYTNGVVVMDGNHDTMPNGTGLNPCPYTTQVMYEGLSIPQADIILPMPGDSTKFYLFHQSVDNLGMLINSTAYYSIIDMTQNSGMGDLSQKNIIFFQDTLCGGGVTACKHANGRDWWLIIPKAHEPTYFLFLITPFGVNFQSAQIIGNRYDFGQAAFSPDGEHYGIHEFNKNFQIFDFDRCTGTLSNYRFVNSNDSNYGTGFCFSPNSKLAYSASAHFLYQVNLDSANLLSSIDTVAFWDSTYNPNPPFETGFEFMQIGPNNKIYMNTVWTTYCMHYINYPDSDGVACDVHQHSIALPTFNGNTIPNFPNYFLGPEIGSICDSLGLGVTENVYEQNLKLRINPNPAQDIFYLNYELPNGTNADVSIYTSLGEKLMHQKIYWYFSYLQLDGGKLNDGVYFIRVETEDKHEAGTKLFITR